MTCQATGDREHRGDHGSAGTEGFDAPVVPRRPESEGCLDSGHAALAETADLAGAGIACEAVDIVHREAGIGHGTLAGLQCQRHRRHHQPSTDFRHPDAGESYLVLELFARHHGAHGLPDLARIDVVRRQGKRRRLFGRRPEQREPHIAVLREDDLHPHTECELCRVALDHVGRQANPLILVDRDLGHHVGCRQPGQAEAVVDRESDESRGTGHHPDTQLMASAVPADRLRRMDESRARLTLLQPQAAIRAGRPEEAVLRRDLGRGRPDSSAAFPLPPDRPPWNQPRACASLPRAVIGSASPCSSQISWSFSSVSSRPAPKRGRVNVAGR